MRFTGRGLSERRFSQQSGTAAITGLNRQKGNKKRVHSTLWTRQHLLLQTLMVS